MVYLPAVQKEFKWDDPLLLRVKAFCASMRNQKSFPVPKKFSLPANSSEKFDLEPVITGFMFKTLHFKFIYNSRWFKCQNTDIILLIDLLCLHNGREYDTHYVNHWGFIR